MMLSNRFLASPLAIILFAGIFATSITGCSGCRDKESPLTEINILVDSSVVMVGEDLQFSVEGVLEDGTELNAEELFEEFEDAYLDWASSDEDIASIDVNGLLTALGGGTVTITGTFYPYGEEEEEEAISGTIVITIEALPAISSIQLIPGSFSIPLDGTQNLVAIAQYDDGTSIDMTSDVTWASSDTGIITVSASGVATGVSAGTSNITASYEEITSNVSSGTVTEASLVSIQLQPPTGQLYAGSTSTIEITAQGVYDDRSTMDLTDVATWASSDNDVASVAGGVVSAGNEAGTAMITATFDGVESSPSVIQILPTQEVVSITVEPADANIPVGATTEFHAIATYGDGRTANVSADAVWTSDDTSVAEMTDAIATGIGEGTATITAAFEGEEGTATLEVTGAELVSIEIDPSIASIANGTTQQFTAIGLFTDDSTQDITADVSWTSSNPATATIDATGLAAGEAQGTVTITATMNGVSKTATLMVTAGVVDGITIVDESNNEIDDIDVYVQGTFTVRALASFTDGTTQNVTPLATWTADPATTASVSPYGVVTGLSEGQAEITASYMGFEAQLTVNVDPAVLVSVQVTPSLPDPLPAGLTFQFTATGTYSDGETVDMTDHDFMTWTSSAENIATISNAPDNKGEATAITVGGTQIRATYDDGVDTVIQSDPVVLNVTQPQLVEIVVVPEETKVIPGFSRPFEAWGTYTDESTSDLTAQVTWTTSDNDIATISNASGSRGIATGHKRGEVTIYATLSGSTVDPGEGILIVEDARLVQLVVTPFESTIGRGESLNFTATGLFSNGEKIDLTENVNVDWDVDSLYEESTKPLINNDGRLTTSSGANPTSIGYYKVIAAYEVDEKTIAGYARVFVTAERVLYDITVHVIGHEDTSFPSDSPYTMPKGWNARLAATGHYCPYNPGAGECDEPDWWKGDWPLTENLTNSVTWQSNNTSAVTIDDASGRKGLVSAIAEGTARVEVRYQGNNYPQDLYVDVLDFGDDKYDVLAACDTNGSSYNVLICPAGYHPEDFDDGCDEYRFDLLQLPRNSTHQFEAMVYFDGCTGGDPSPHIVTADSRWSVNPAGFATVNNTNNKGRVNVLNIDTGNTTHIEVRFPAVDVAHSDDPTAVRQIGVGKPCVTSIAFNPDTADVPHSGLSGQMRITAQMSDFSTRNFSACAEAIAEGDETIVTDIDEAHPDFTFNTANVGEGSITGTFIDCNDFVICDINVEKLEFEATVNVGHFNVDEDAWENDEFVSMVIVPDNVTIPRGGHYDLQAIATFASGATYDLTDFDYLEWKSYPITIAEVDSDGRITANKNRDGHVVVTATIPTEAGPTYSATADVTVTGQEVGDVNISRLDYDECINDGEYPVGAAIPLNAVAVMTDDDEELDVTSDATWVSSNAAIVEITSDGWARMKGAGTARIHATYAGVSSAIECSGIGDCNDGMVCHNNQCFLEIKVSNETPEWANVLVDIKGNYQEDGDGRPIIYRNQTIAMRATAKVSFGEAEDMECNITDFATWSGTNTRITHLGKGIFRGTVNGITRAEAVIGGSSGQSEDMIVMDGSAGACVAGISKTPSSRNVAEGATREISITGWVDQRGNTYSIPVDPEYKWSSEDTEIFTVDAEEGTTTVVEAEGNPGDSALLTAILQPNGYHSCQGCIVDEDCAELGDGYHCIDDGCWPSTEITISIVDATVDNFVVECYNARRTTEHSPAIEKVEIGDDVPRGVMMFCEASGELTNDIEGNVSQFVSWEVTPSLNLEIVSVESDGVWIRTKAAGNGTVNAIVGSNIEPKSIEVTTSHDDDLGIYDAYGNLVEEIGAVNGFTGQYYMHVDNDGIMYDATNLATWSSGNNAVVTVTNTEPKGTVSVVGQSASTVTISAANVGRTATMDVKTTGISYTAFEVCADINTCADSFEVGKGQERQLYAYATYDGIKLDVTAQTTWSSADENSVTVVGGLIEGHDDGTFTDITAQYLTNLKEVEIQVMEACVDEIELIIENLIGQPLTELHRNMPFYVNIIGTLSDDSATVDVTHNADFAEVRCDEYDVCNNCTDDCLLVYETVTKNGDPVNVPRLFDHQQTTGQVCNNHNDCGDNQVCNKDGICEKTLYYFIVRYDLEDIDLPADVLVRAVVEEEHIAMCPGIEELEEMTENLEVTEADLLSIEVLPANEHVPFGETQTYTARGHFSSGHQFDMTRRVHFSSSDEDIATFANKEKISIITGNNKLRVIDNIDNLGLSSWVVATEMFYSPPAKGAEIFGTHAGYTQVTASEGVLQQIILAGKYTRNTDCQDKWVFTTEGINIIGDNKEDDDYGDYIRFGSANEKMYISNATAFEHPKGGYTTFIRAIGVYSGGIKYRDLTSEVNWSVNGPATVTEDGRITTGAAEGTAEFTAAHANLDDAEINLIVVDGTLGVLQLLAGDGSVPLGLQFQIGAFGTFAGVAYCIIPDVNWSITDGEEFCMLIAEEPGLLEAMARDVDADDEPIDTLCVVEGEVGALSTEEYIYIVEEILQSIEIVPTELEMNCGEWVQLQAIGWYSDGTWDYVTENVSWQVTEPGVVDLDDEWVEAIHPGEVSVYACYEALDICSHEFFDEEINDWVKEEDEDYRYSSTITVLDDEILCMEID